LIPLFITAALERLARVVQDRTPKRENLLPAVEKLNRLEKRLEELVPAGDLTSEQRLEWLVNRTHEMDPEVQPELSFVKRLERLGDARAGFSPIQD